MEKELKTIEWRDDRGLLILIDQRYIPHSLRYFRCRTVEDVAFAIKEMVVRGAPAIGVTAAFGMALAARNSKARTREELIGDLREAKKMLASTRPTAVNLFWSLDRVMRVAESTVGDVMDVKDAVLREAISMADEDVKINKAIGRFGSSLLEDGDKVLTHCN
ncbi:Methylthioribose-1-phosphate isomerase [archaeon HR01]|nr:Methylthioribose-1-phosphate isomerase [archaeon HR01]